MADIPLNELHKMEMRQLSRERGREPDPAYWRWSPSDIRIWAQMLHVANEYLCNYYGEEYHQLSIWEAGSGIGTKLYYAKHHYGMIEYGFELFDYYVAAAKELGVACEQRDLSDLDDQPSWEVPDIVFTARPFKNDILENRWEKLVQDQMRPGAVLISTFTSKKPYGWPVLYRATFRGVWVKPGPVSPEPESVQSTVTISLYSRGKPPSPPRRLATRAGEKPLPKIGKGRYVQQVQVGVHHGARGGAGARRKHGSICRGNSQSIAISADTDGIPVEAPPCTRRALAVRLHRRGHRRPQPQRRQGRRRDPDVALAGDGPQPVHQQVLQGTEQRHAPAQPAAAP